MKKLIEYLLQHIQLDFEGELTLDAVRDFLREDDSREARRLLGKLIDDQGVDEMMIVVADCLKDHIRTGINEKVIEEQLQTYSES